MSEVGYRLATEDDIEKAYQLTEAEGLHHEGFEFPTIVAIEDDEVVGVLGTNISDNMVIAGPLVIKSDKPRRWTILRLIEIYDVTMRSLGMKSYIHAVEEGNEKWLDFIKRTYGAEPYAFENGHYFFVKRLDDGPESQSSRSLG